MKNNFSGSPIPSEKYLHLLKACLLSDNEAFKGFEAWRKLVDFETGIEYATHRMLPLLYNNLKGLQIDDPIITRLKGIYKKKWSENNIFFYKIKDVLLLLKSMNLRIVVLKGVPLAVEYYKNVALRSMADIDLLILKSERRACIQALEKEGYTLKENATLDYLLRTFRSVTMVKDGLEIDVHWSPILESFGIQSENMFWENTVPIEVMGVQLETFCATDQLFHILIHGFRFNPEPPIRWVADAHAILHTEKEIDWERLWILFEKHKVILQSRGAIQFLQQEFYLNFPEALSKKLHEYRPTISEKILFKNAMEEGWQFENPTTFAETVRMHYYIHLRQSTQRSFLFQNLAFVSYTSQLIAETPRFFVKRFFMLLFKPLAQKKKV